MAFTLQGFGPFLHWLTLVILCVLPIVVGIVLFKLGSLPGSIAAARGHPQAAAINVCGWMGLITFVLWPIAMVWAYLNRRPAEESGPCAQGSRSVVDALEQASQRLAVGDAAVYSGNIQIAGVIRMALMRMTSWTNFLYFTD